MPFVFLSFLPFTFLPFAILPFAFLPFCLFAFYLLAGALSILARSFFRVLRHSDIPLRIQTWGKNSQSNLQLGQSRGLVHFLQRTLPLHYFYKVFYTSMSGLVAVHERSSDGGPVLDAMSEETVAHVQPDVSIVFGGIDLEERGTLYITTK